MRNTVKILLTSLFAVLFLDTTLHQKDLDKYLRNCGLVDIQKINSKIKVKLAYSSTTNFLNIDLYGDLNKCYLPKEVALAVSKAQNELDKISSHYQLIIFDGTRPLHIQQLMWDSLKLPIEQKTKYLAYPGSTSLHNYGAAIDLGLITNDGVIVNMGTSFDHFGPEAHITNENQLVKEGKITKENLIYRKLLRKVMLLAGFKTMSTEWWHFNYCTKEEAAKKFELIK